MRSVLLDTTSQPSAREVIGSMLRAASHADIAVRNIRLASLDLSDAETRELIRCRVLIGTLDVNTLAIPGLTNDSRRFRTLLDFLMSGRVEIRSAGMGTWTPDFSIYSRVSRAGITGFSVCLVGAHYFHAPVADPAFTCVLREHHAVEQARKRFDTLWDGGYDVNSTVIDTVRRVTCP